MSVVEGVSCCFALVNAPKKKDSIPVDSEMLKINASSIVSWHIGLNCQLSYLLAGRKMKMETRSLSSLKFSGFIKFREVHICLLSSFASAMVGSYNFVRLV